MYLIDSNYRLCSREVYFAIFKKRILFIYIWIVIRINNSQCLADLELHMPEIYRFISYLFKFFCTFVLSTPVTFGYNYVNGIKKTTNGAHAVKIDSNNSQNSNNKLIASGSTYQKQQNIMLVYTSIFFALYLHMDNNVN